MSIQLEHSNVWLTCHLDTQCKGEFCTMHNRSDHSMRSFPQHWRADRGIMERICTHSVGHPDPDEITEDRTHGCDGCCGTPREGVGMNSATCTWCNTVVNEQDLEMHAGEHYRKQVELMKFNPLTTVTSISSVSYVKELG